MDHSDLVAEMVQVEHLTTQERLHLARRRRIQQLKCWAQRERDWIRSRHKNNSGTDKAARPKRNVFFTDSVMLLEAAARNDIDEVRRLLGRGVTPDATNEDGLTALHQCCIDNNEEMLKLLLDKGANVNAEDSEKWTPLHAAATCGHLQLVKTLIQRGANLLAVNADGNMPYDICEDEASLDCIEGEMAARGVTQRLIDTTRGNTERTMLRDLKQVQIDGGDLEFRDQHGATPLHIAAANGYLKVVEFLLDHHVSTDVKDNDLWQPVHAAACWGHLEVLEILVHNGADLNAKNKHDETPADICEDSEMRARIAQLLSERESRKRVSGSGSVGGTRRGTGGARPSSSRAHSVRRTSLRERGLTAKHDAHEEARLRNTFVTNGLPNGVENSSNLQQNGSSQKRSQNGSTPVELGGQYEKQQKNSSANHQADSHSQISADSQASSNYVPKITNPLYGVNAASSYLTGSLNSSTGGNSPTSTNYVGFNKNKSDSKYLQENKPDAPNSLTNGVRKAPEGQDNDSYLHEDDVDSPKDMIVSSNQMDMAETSSATHYTTDNNGKINVHVTVMINAGTLADLKKQRAQIRNSSPTESSLISPTSIESTGSSKPIPSSPVPFAGDVPRFSGNTSEVIGDARSNRCCIIM